MRCRSWWNWSPLSMMLLTAVAARGEDPPVPAVGVPVPVPVARQLPELHLLEGPWNEGVIQRESVLFVRGKEGKPAAKLLYDVERIVSVRAATGTNSFQPDRDFVVSDDRSGLKLPDGSTIPFLNEADLFPPKGSPNSIGHRAGHPEMNILFDNGHFFHDRQIEVTYLPRVAKWDAATPKFAGAQARTHTRQAAQEGTVDDRAQRRQHLRRLQRLGIYQGSALHAVLPDAGRGAA